MSWNHFLAMAIHVLVLQSILFSHLLQGVVLSPKHLTVQFKWSICFGQVQGQYRSDI